MTIRVGRLLRYAVCIAPIVVGAYLWLGDRPITHGPGVIAPEQPVQVKVNELEHFTYKNHTITPLARFEVTARVLSRKNYSFGHESKLSPIDLALGWGPMSDEAVLDGISVSQSGRWYRWSVKEFPIPRQDIERNSANFHLIPSTPEIKKRLKRVRRGHLVECRGYLVEVSAPDGWSWRSSLTRNDTGESSCELVWVEEFAILQSASEPLE